MFALGGVRVAAEQAQEQGDGGTEGSRRPNQVLEGDITYVATTDGWLYLAVLLDIYSRRVVGWAMSDRIDTELALSTLRAAASTEPNWVHHTDRDCRYGSDDYLAALKQLGARSSSRQNATR